jgi:hypothetical protein
MWTKKYKPIEVMKIIETNDFDEDKITLKCMAKFGIDNVRGGSFCKIELDDDDKIVINKMLCGSCDKCYLCGKLFITYLACDVPLTFFTDVVEESIFNYVFCIGNHAI